MLIDYRYVRRRVCVREHTINACCYGPRHGDRVAEAQRNRPTCSGDFEKPSVGRATNPKTGWKKLRRVWPPQCSVSSTVAFSALSGFRVSLNFTPPRQARKARKKMTVCSMA